ncbi:glycerophosphoryl diester phosphodiesterase membrane domain-containing protein [Demetria terragena]|uniref:glycerophosphoryl diester phosphodiesterase membrane domain-containing protein n=1 Tax=Demetria terragena TaxID=63959 RepID=UPI00035E5485|nr:glycerophosphoryl diester phosphodiesterase membrane domain-containing protein [Demetria terragena]
MAPQPGVIPLRALTVGDIMSGAMRTIRGNPGATLGLSLLVNLILALPIVALAIALESFDPGDGVVRTMLQYSSDSTFLVLSLGSLLLSGMVTVVVSEAVLGHRATIGQVWRKIKGRIWALLGVGLLTALVLAIPFLLIVMAVVVGEAIGGVGGGSLATIGVIAGLLGILYLYIKTLFAAPATVLERVNPIASLKRSWALTRAQWWRTFGIILLTQFVVQVIFTVLMIIAGIIGVGGVLAADGGGAALVVLAVILIALAAAFFLLLMMLTSSFMSSVTGLMYIDQRIRKEALDVTLMAAAQQTPTT